MIEAQTKPWDIAAMRVIIEESGGRFTDISGGTEFKGDVLNSVASNGLIHDEVLAYPRTREPRIYPWVNGFLSPKALGAGCSPQHRIQWCHGFTRGAPLPATLGRHRH